MYACKRRQRNFRRVRESTRPNQPTNPSKRHRERLNGELETVASLLPYDDATIQRLDKLSVLRLAVSFVQIKAHFALYLRQQQAGITGSEPPPQLASLAAPNAMFTALSPFSTPIVPIPTLLSPQGLPSYDIHEASFTQLALKSVGGFVVLFSEWGDIYYVSENIDQYLGFCQSDVMHQSITDLLHSEDRESILKALKVQTPKVKGNEISTKIEYDSMERIVMGRFRCLLDNTCGFVRMEVRGKFIRLSALATPSDEIVPSKEKSKFMHTPYALAAICTPFVPPAHLEQTLEDPILKTKHGLDLSFLCIDSRIRHILEIEDSIKSGGMSFYQFVHPDDAKCLSECHEETRKNGSSALLVLRLISSKSQIIYNFQSSFRLFYKSGKAESIGITHRYLTEIDGISLLEKRGTVKGSIFTHDEPSLHSPRTLSTTQNLVPLLIKEENDSKAFESHPLLRTKKASAEKGNVSSSRESKKGTSLKLRISNNNNNNNNSNINHSYSSASSQISTSNALGAISCLEELVKASTSSFYPTPPPSTTKESKTTKTKSASKIQQQSENNNNFSMPINQTDQLPTLSAVFPQYLQQSMDFQHSHPHHHHHHPQGSTVYPHAWPISDPTFDFSAYYQSHPMTGYPQTANDYSSFNAWFPDSSNASFFSEQINGYYHHLYPQNDPTMKSHPNHAHSYFPENPSGISAPPHPTPITAASTRTGIEEDAAFLNHSKFALPALNTAFQTGTKHDAIVETSNNFSFLNEVAHTLFGQ